MDCQSGDYLYMCDCVSPSERVEWECADVEGALGACNAACDGGAGASAPPDRVVCSSYDPEGSCTGWAPENSIRLVGGIYLVDGALIDGLITNSAPLWTCDTMTVEPNGAVFELSGGGSGELLYELGLRDGDIPEELNGMPLLSYADAAAAFIQLWYVEEEAEYELKVLRSSPFGSPVVLTFYYEVDR